MSRLTISLLGSFQVMSDGVPVTGFATDKVRALLAYLAVEADRPHRREALAGLLWPDQPERKANQNLRQALVYLRQAIGGDEVQPFLQITREAIQFNADSDYWLDAAAFTTLIEACKGHRHRRLETCLPCLRRLEQMAELYRGSFLEQFSLGDSSIFEEWALLKREWLHRKMVEALSYLADYYERRGDLPQARQYAWRQVELEPWREEAHRQLMRLLALDGQRSAALAQYEACRVALVEELGVEPTAETVALYERIRAGGILRSATPLRNLPPAPTPFVGREGELAELAHLLSNPDYRLVALVGPGGIGKTRLALQAAADQIGTFAHGVYFVPLASVNSTDLIVPAIAETLEFSFQEGGESKEQLLGYLREKELLLVLDNMEHLLPPSACGDRRKDGGGAELLAEMLRCAPGVVLLVTSRERLALQEEWVYEVGGLTYPTSPLIEEWPGERWSTFAAIELFRQRASQASRRFALAEALPGVVRICQLVEGMPLAVELSAAWVTVRSCEEIAQELERNLDILTTRLRNVPKRQRSVWATFEYSWQLLSAAEQDLFMRLSVFRGGFRQDAAEAVAGASVPMLSALLDKSLIRRVSSDRYDVHELLRQYAAEKLALQLQDQEETLMRHARYFAAFLQRQEDRLKGAQQKQAFLEIAPEIENARQAWQLGVTRDWVDKVEQSLESLYHFYDGQGRFQEGSELFAQAIDRWSGDSPRASIWGRVMARQGALYHRLGFYQQARTCLEQSLAIAERLETPAEQIFCLVKLASVARRQGKLQETERLAQKSLTLSRQIQDSWGAMSSLFLLGTVLYDTGNVDQAEALLEEGLAIGRASGNQCLVLSPLNALGDIACHRGDFSKAQVLFEECLAWSRELGLRFNVAMHLNNLGTVLHSLERYAEARSLYQESLEICREIGDQAGQAIALSNLGEIAFALGESFQARQYYQEGLAIGRSIQEQWMIMVCLNNLGEIACALGNYQEARGYLAETIQVATQTQTLTILMKALVNLAVLFAQQGQAGRASELLWLACQHPASERDTQKKAERLSAQWGLAPPSNSPRSPDVIVAEILAEISPPT